MAIVIAYGRFDLSAMGSAPIVFWHREPRSH